MTITEFAQTREVQSQTISSALRRHGFKYNKYEGLTDSMLAFLEKEYPEPKKTIIVNGLSQEEERELRQQLEELHSKLEEAQSIIINLTNVNADLKLEANSNQLLLESRDNELKKAQNELEEAQQIISNKEQELSDLRKRGLIARILNRI